MVNSHDATFVTLDASDLDDFQSPPASRQVTGQNGETVFLYRGQESPDETVGCRLVKDSVDRLEAGERVVWRNNGAIVLVQMDDAVLRRDREALS